MISISIWDFERIAQDVMRVYFYVEGLRDEPFILEAYEDGKLVFRRQYEYPWSISMSVELPYHPGLEKVRICVVQGGESGCDEKDVPPLETIPTARITDISIVRLEVRKGVLVAIPTDYIEKGKPHRIFVHVEASEPGNYQVCLWIPGRRDFKGVCSRRYIKDIGSFEFDITDNGEPYVYYAVAGLDKKVGDKYRPIGYYWFTYILLPELQHTVVDGEDYVVLDDTLWAYLEGYKEIARERKGVEPTLSIRFGMRVEVKDILPSVADMLRGLPERVVEQRFKEYVAGVFKREMENRLSQEGVSATVEVEDVEILSGSVSRAIVYNEPIEVLIRGVMEIDCPIALSTIAIIAITIITGLIAATLITYFWSMAVQAQAFSEAVKEIAGADKAYWETVNTIFEECLKTKSYDECIEEIKKYQEDNPPPSEKVKDALEEMPKEDQWAWLKNLAFIAVAGILAIELFKAIRKK